MTIDISAYNNQQSDSDRAICGALARIIDDELNEAERKIWHAHPVWFLDKNPIVGYSKEKKGIRLLFWSGADFDEERLYVKGQKFKDASIFYSDETEIDIDEVRRWLKKSREIQWDYKHIVQRKGKLERLI